MDKLVELFDYLDTRPAIIYIVIIFVNWFATIWYYYKMKRYKDDYVRINKELDDLYSENHGLKGKVLNLNSSNSFLESLNSKKEKLLKIQNEKIIIIEEMLEKNNKLEKVEEKYGSDIPIE